VARTLSKHEMSQLGRYASPEAVEVPNRKMTPLRLEPTDARVQGIDAEGGGVRFSVAGWYEVLLTVPWDRDNREGHRFAHTVIADEHPLHSEAIEAVVLADLSGGRKLLRGNSVFGPKAVDWIELEVWQDSGVPVRVEGASIEVRPLPNPIEP
jgi:hypothetical protein